LSAKLPDFFLWIYAGIGNLSYYGGFNAILESILSRDINIGSYLSTLYPY